MSETSKPAGFKQNIPNMITLSRFFMVPAIILFYLGAFEHGRLIAAIIFAVASLTDFLDGYLARIMNVVSDFGKLVDPVVDKILTTVGFILILSDPQIMDAVIPIWLGVVVFSTTMLREYAVATIRQLAAISGVAMAAGMIGKIKSFVQFIAIMFIIIWAIYMPNDIVWANVAMSTTGFITFISMIIYMRDYMVGRKKEGV